MTPRPKLPPIPNAPFLTEGRMTRHSALSSKSCGISSGILRISFRTSPDSFTRSCSFRLSANAVGRRTNVKSNASRAFMKVNFLRAYECSAISRIELLVRQNQLSFHYIALAITEVWGRKETRTFVVGFLLGEHGHHGHDLPV